jgi:hypothetical protein
MNKGNKGPRRGEEVIAVEIRRGYREWADAEERKRSPEVDFGVWWYERGKERPTWRVSWIERTGELYGVEQIPEADSPKRRFVVLGRFATREEVERFMEGWAEEPKELGPLVNHLAKRDSRGERAGGRRR